MVSQILSLAFQLNNYTNNLLFLCCFFFFLFVFFRCVSIVWVPTVVSESNIGCVLFPQIYPGTLIVCLYRRTMSLVLESVLRRRPRPCCRSACCSRVLFPVVVCCGLAPPRCHLAKSALPSGIKPCFPVIETCGRVRNYEAAVQ